MASRRPTLIEIDWPEFGEASPPARPSAAEYAGRLQAVQARMRERSLTHLAVYGDREHFANLAWLTGFDPRFEEALLIVRPTGTPLLLLGNECMGYIKGSPLWLAGGLRVERWQPLSLLDQDRSQSRDLDEILRDEGVATGARVGCVGWKYFSEQEHRLGRRALDLPAFLADSLRDLAGRENVENATDLFQHPAHGLRTTCSATDIAYLEWTNGLASDGVRRVLFGLAEGALDFDLARLAGLCGVPLGCHVTLKVGDNRVSLASPNGSRLRRGGTFSLNVCYWGANVCRCGWAAESAGDLPEAARDYVDAFVGPYFAAMADWYGLLRVGQPGGAFDALIRERLPFKRFGIFLNPGHLIHLDEWVSSPMFPGSTVPLRSGMAIQVDVIPSNPTYYSTRMEDGVVLADEALRDELRGRSPALMTRCEERRAFLGEVLGISVSQEVLPLGNMQGIVVPFGLSPRNVMALR